MNDNEIMDKNNRLAELWMPVEGKTSSIIAANSIKSKLIFILIPFSCNIIIAM